MANVYKITDTSIPEKGKMDKYVCYYQGIMNISSMY